MRIIIIVAGGWSAGQYPLTTLHKYGDVIGVNDAAVRIPCSVGITMDRLWAEHRARDFYLANPSAPLFVRRGADKNIPRHPRLKLFDCCDKSVVMSDEPGVLNGTNSGTVALNYAYQMHPREIYLFGYDMQRGPGDNPYWYPPYSWVSPIGATKSKKYMRWADEFNSIAAQFTAKKIIVRVVSNRSRITAFPQISFEQFLREV